MVFTRLMQFLFNYLGEWKFVWLCYLLFDKSPDTNKIHVNLKMSSNKRVDVKGYSFIAVQGINQFYIYHQINFSISLTDSLHISPFLGCFELPLSSYWFSLSLMSWIKHEAHGYSMFVWELFLSFWKLYWDSIWMDNLCNILWPTSLN